MREIIENIKNELIQMSELEVDSTSVKSQLLKNTIDELRTKKISSLISYCDEVLTRIADDEKTAKKIAEQEAKPMYFDILRANGTVDAHIFSLNGMTPILNPGDKLVRTYNSKNVVQSEIENANSICPDYNDVFKETLAKIKKLMNSDERGKLGVTTILNEYPEYARPSEHLISKEELDAIELPDYEKLPKGFVDTCLKFDNPKAKLTKNDVWNDSLSEASVSKAEKQKKNTKPNVKKASKAKKASTKKNRKGSK